MADSLAWPLPHDNSLNLSLRGQTLNDECGTLMSCGNVLKWTSHINVRDIVPGIPPSLHVTRFAQRASCLAGLRFSKVPRVGWLSSWTGPAMCS